MDYLDDRRVEAELRANVAPGPWQRTVLAALATHADQPLLVADHDAFSIKPDSGLRIIRVTDMPHRNTSHSIALENEASAGAKIAQTPPTVEGDTRKRGLSRGAVVAVMLPIILSGLLVYSGWQWRRSTQDVVDLKTQVNKLEEALSGARADNKRLMEDAERLQKENEASAHRDASFQDSYQRWLQLRDQLDKLFSGYGDSGPER